MRVRENTPLRETMRRKSSPSSSSSSNDEVYVPNVRKRNVHTKKSPQKKGMTLALTSGIFASLAGTFGKFAMNQTETLLICEQVSNSQMHYSLQESYLFCEKAAVYIRIVSFIIMILLNAIMWTTFVKALRYCKTSLEATVTNTAANFFSSAIVGQLIFDESVSLMWWLGTLLIIFGLVLMNYGGQDKSRKGEIARRKKYKSR